MTASKWLLVFVLATSVALMARPVAAQDDQVEAADVVSISYFTSLISLVLAVPADAFGFDREAAVAGPALNKSLVNEIGGFPIGSSSGGFTYFFDPASGTAVRSSPSFGPAFAERPLTSGRGRLNVGFSYLRRSFSDFEGIDIGDGSLLFTTPLEFFDGGNADIIESSFRLDVVSDTATFFATYGVLDRLDISVAVPIQRVSVESSVTSQLLRFGPANDLLPVPAFTASESRESTGIGDIAIRSKYNLFSTNAVAAATGFDLRLPTGDESDLRGTGRTRTKVYGAFASEIGNVFPHANVGFSFQSVDLASESILFDSFGSEISYTAGAEFVLHPRLTVIGDIVGRSHADHGRFEQQTRTEELVAVVVRAGGRVTTLPAEERTVTGLTYAPFERLNTVLAAVGAKFSPTSTVIVSGHVLVQLTDAGLRSKVTPVIGIDYTF